MNSTRPLRLGLVANWRQFTLLVIVNGFVGAMLGLVTGFGWRRGWLVLASVVLLASARGAASQRAWQPLAPQPVAGPATLLEDPAAGWCRLAGGGATG